MNKLYLLLSLLIILTGCSKESGTPAPSQEKYVQSVTAYMHYLNGQRVKWSSESYTPEGLISKKEYRGDKRVEEPCFCKVTEVNTYENEVLKERTVQKMFDNSFTKYTYSYSNNRLVEMKEYVNSEYSGTYKYEYDGANHPSRMLHYVADLTEPYLTYTYTYNGAGRVVEENSVYFNGVGNTIKREYDELGNLSRETSEKMGGGYLYVRHVSYYTYDAKGRISEREFSTYTDREFQKWVYHYGDDKQPGSKGRLYSVDVYEATTPDGREYELKGVLRYEYTFL
ncbi:hypothetical protein ABID22_000708 [Pontibacter aydingkolensis]|uniref:YD repeat-containing protein n=1 Tax=Pontibacter aydingkolensis TaxID=1911536 RepID=A0ABS7CRD4_9BACT|nr:hypothetical protein [Pontibacter aydingkolensis]MBW7466417.1 hypothetical protein [Pontibacter aydingkolensis]